MNSQLTFVERRKSPRFGVMAGRQNIIYNILRKRGAPEPVREAPPAAATTQPVQQRGDTPMAKLMLVARNDQPQREKSCPQTWLLYKRDTTTEVHVRHDSLNRPFVFDKGAA
jgi:hypothetical protein